MCRAAPPEPPPATGATSASSVLPALAPRRGISVYRSAANPSRRKFGLAPTPLRLFISPVGVPSGTGPPARGGFGPSDPTGRSCSTNRPTASYRQKIFGLAPTPRGASRLGAEAGDAKHRDLLSQTSPPNTRPGSHYGGDSRDPLGRNCPTGRPILGRPARKTTPPHGH